MKLRTLQVASICVVCAWVVFLGGCGGGSGIRISFPGGTALAIDQGQSITITASATNDSGEGVTWACTGAACTTLAGATTTQVTFTASGATGTATITATSVKQNTITGSVTIAVNAVPTITTAQGQVTAAPATAGTAYTFTLTSSGGSGNLTWSATGLPIDGLTLSSAGVISGTPTAHGSFVVVLTVTDSSAAGAKASSTVSVTITVNNPAPPAITTIQSQVSGGTAGVVYGFTFHATGSGTLTWAAVGLSDGLTLNTATGAISGTPTSQAAVSFTLTVSDTFGQASAATPFTITVANPAAPAITTTQGQVTAAPATVGTLYSFTFHATGSGTLTWSAVGLSDGLALNTSTGVISGTPTTHTMVSFTLNVSDSFGQSAGATGFSITVNNPAAPVISTTLSQVPSATVSVPYNFTFLGTGYAQLTWSTTPALTDGLSINTSTGVVTGTPTAPTTLNFSVSLTDGVGQVTTVTGFSILVSTESVAFTPSAPSSVTAGGTLGVNATVSGDVGNGGVDWTVTCTGGSCGSFTAAHTASGTATTFNAPALPPTGGTVTITATAHDAPSPLVSAVVTVNAQPLVITTSTLPSGTQSSAYTATITASGGVPPYTFTLDASSATLPANLVFNSGSPSTTITGTPTGTGTTSGIIIDVKDSETVPLTQQMTYSITVNAVSASCASAPTGHEAMLSGQYAFQIQGFTGSGSGIPVASVGSFHANGDGTISGGTIDSNSSGGYVNATINSSGSSYKVGLDSTSAGNLGCIVLSTSGGTVTFAASLNAISPTIVSKGRIIRFDDTLGTGTRGSGILRLQTGPFAFSATQNLAFGLDGWDSSGSHLGGGGFFTLSTGGNITNLSADFDDGGTLDFGLTGPILGVNSNNGTITAPDSTTGRSTITDNYTVSSTTQTFHFASYRVSTSEYFVVSTDTISSSSPLTSGRLFATGAASSFSQSSISGNFVVHVTGFDLGNHIATITLGLLNLTGGGVNGTLYQYEAVPNGEQTSTITAGGYIVAAASGRTVLTGAGNNPPVLYLVTPAVDGISAIVIGTDNSTIFGYGEASAGTGFTTAGLAGHYFFGTEDPSDNSVTDEDGVVTLAPSGSCTGTQNASGSSGLSTGLVTGGGSCTFTITNVNGTGNVGTNTIAIAGGTKIFFFDEGDTVGGSPAKITVLEQQ